MFKQIIKKLYKFYFPIEINYLEDYYNNKYPHINVSYKGRAMPGSTKRFSCDLRNFFTLTDDKLHTIVKDIKGTDNEKALKCLAYVLRHFRYHSDKSTVNLPEYWQFPFESLQTNKGDCEDGAILLANLLLVSGIPNWKVRINAGNVKAPNKGFSGHAYVTYFDEISGEWKLLDWCYYQNMEPIEERKNYKDEEFYKDVWFSFNNKYCWAKSQGDVRKMNKITI